MLLQYLKVDINTNLYKGDNSLKNCYSKTVNGTDMLSTTILTQLIKRLLNKR